MAVQAELHDRPTAKGFGGNGDGSPWTGLLEVAQAFYRWQNTYSPADTLEQDFPGHQHYLLQQALSECLPGWDLRVTASFRSEEVGTLPLRRIVVPSGPGTWGTALDDARLGYVSPTGERVMARVSVSVHPTGSGEVACLFLIGPTGQAAFLQTLVETLETWMAAHPHLCGAKLDAKGDFLKFGRPHTWEDIVLSPSVRAEVETHLCKFVARVARYQDLGVPTKRGILLVGPPGTGKTLLGKILCATVPATFLWVSPGQVRDPGQLQWLFGLAREHQPTVLSWRI